MVLQRKSCALVRANTLQINKCRISVSYCDQRRVAIAKAADSVALAEWTSDSSSTSYGTTQEGPPAMLEDREGKRTVCGGKGKKE